MPRRGRARRTDLSSARRSGPAGEAQWWDPADQAAAEQPLLTRRDLPKGWRPVPMINNVERLDPWEGLAAADALQAARSARRLTALDEGTAWRDGDRRLVVIRVELFADEGVDDTEHRAAWLADGVACLEAAWRARWVERDHGGAWVEARLPEHDHGWSPPPTAVPVDHYAVEDHADPTGRGAVTMYQHVTLWAGRAHVVLTARHPLGSDITELDKMVAAAADRAAARAPDRGLPHHP